MKQSIKFFQLFFCLMFCFFMQADENQQRNLLIIVDQEANIGEYNPAAVWYLRSALEKKVCPILVDVNILQDLIQRWYEFSQRALEEETQEYFMVSVHNTIIERLHYWSQFFTQFSTNPATIGTLTQEKVKEELVQQYPPNQKINDESINGFIFYLIQNVKKDWNVYKVNEHFCLLVPIVEHIPGSEENADKDSLTGFNLSKFQSIQEPFAPNSFTFIKKERSELELLHALQQLFASSAYSWNIFLIGHGLDRKVSNKLEFEHMIADLSIEEFQEILYFFNNSIKTNLFLYQTCYGAGKHLEQVYQDYKTQENIILNYTVIVFNLTDVPSYSLILHCKSIDSFAQLNLSSYHYNLKTNQWKFACEFYRPRKKMFELLKRINFSDYLSNLNPLYQMLQITSQNILENTPQLRLANHNFFMPIYNIYDSIGIDQTLVEVKKLSTAPLIINNDTKFALVSTPYLDIPLILKNNSLRVISTMPGQATHFIKQIEARTFSVKDLISSFWPLTRMAFDKIYYIKHLIVNPHFLTNKDIVVDPCRKKETELQDMILFIDKDRLVKFFFKVKDEKAWGGFARTVTFDESSADAELRVSSYALDEEATKRYQQLCEELQNQWNSQNNTMNETLAAMIDALKTTTTV